MLVRFAEEQKPLSDGERKAWQRKRDRQFSKGDVTNMSRKRDIEIEVEIEKEVEVEENTETAAASVSFEDEVDIHIRGLTERFTEEHMRNGFEVVPHLAEEAVKRTAIHISKRRGEGKNSPEYMYEWIAERYIDLLVEVQKMAVVDKMGPYLGR